MIRNIFVLFVCCITLCSLQGQLVDGGSITLPEGDTTSIICLTSDQSSILDVVLNDNVGENSSWVLTNEKDSIIGLPLFPPFDFSVFDEQKVKIWHLSYQSVDGLILGKHKDDISGDFDYSNAICVEQKSIFPSILTLVSEDTIFTCVGDDIRDSLVFAIDQMAGSNNVIVAVDEKDEIIGIFENLITPIDSLRSGICVFYHITYEEINGGLNLGDTLSNLEGCYEISNGISIVKNLVDGGEIYLDDQRTTITICVGDGVADAFTPSLSNDFGPESRWIITDSTGIMLAILSNNTFNLEGVGPGKCRIYHISYEQGITNLERLIQIDSLSGCFDLSNAITINRLRGETEGGILTSSNSNFCNGDMIKDTLTVSLSNNIGDQSVFLITDISGLVLDTFSRNQYDFEGFQKLDQCLIYGLSYINGLDRLTIGANIDELEGCHALSNGIVVNFNYVEAGTIQFRDSTDQITICSKDGLQDLIDPLIKDTCSQNYNWIIVQDDTIKAVQNLFDLDIDLGLLDTSYLQLVAYNDLPNDLDAGSAISALSGCYQLTNRLTILNSNGQISGGLLSTEDALVRCNGGTLADTLSWSITGALGDTSLFVLTNLMDQILDITQDTFIESTTLSDGSYSIYHLSSSTFFDSLKIGGYFEDIIGCFAVSNSIEFEVRSVAGGSISSDFDGMEVCIIGGDRVPIAFDLSAAIGPLSSYVITDTDGVIDSVLPFSSVFVTEDFKDSFFIYNVTYFDGIAGLNKGLNVSNLIGCYALSNPLPFYIKRLEKPLITFDDSTQSRTICRFNLDSIVRLNSTIFDVEVSALGVFNTNDSLLFRLDSLHFEPSIYSFSGDTFYIRQFLALDTIEIDSEGVFTSRSCLTASNPLELVIQTPQAGQLSMFGDTSILLCLTPDLDTVISIDINNNRSQYSQLVYTYKSDTIKGLLDQHFNPNDFEEDSIVIYHIAYFDSLESPIGKSINDVNGCLEFSDPFRLSIARISAGKLASESGDSILNMCIGEMDLAIILEEISDYPSKLVLTNSDTTILAMVDSLKDLRLDTLTEGAYLIWHIVGLDSMVIDQVLDSIIHSSIECSDISEALKITIESEIDELGIIQLDTIQYQCAADIQRTFCFSDINTVEGLWLVLDEENIIRFINDTSCFKIPNDQVYTVAKVNFNTLPSNLNEGTNIVSIRGCTGISNSIEIAQTFNDAGVISTQSGETDISLCGIGFTAQMFDFEINSEGYEESFWVITDTNNIVIDTFYSLPITIDNNGPLTCRVYHIAYLSGVDLPHVDSSLNILEGCYDLSNPINIKKSLLRGGALTANGGNAIEICAGDLVPDEINISIFNATGENNAWVLSDTLGQISSILATPPNNFNGQPNGSCLLRHIRYTDEINGLDVGDNIRDIVGCYAFSDSVRIDKTSVNGGELTVKDTLRELNICVNDGIEESIIPNLKDRIGPDSLWMVTSVIGEILDISSVPPFNFEGQGEGQCFIWMVSFGKGAEGIQEGLFLADIEGCFAISNPIRIRKHVDDDCVLSNEQVSQDLGFTIYPNPTTDRLTIKNTSTFTGRIEIYSSAFAKIKSVNVASSNTIDLEISSLPQGFYFLSIVTNEGTTTIPFVKQ